LESTLAEETQISQARKTNKHFVASVCTTLFPGLTENRQIIKGLEQLLSVSFMNQCLFSAQAFTMHRTPTEHFWNPKS